jgi:hypothetical protein
MAKDGRNLTRHSTGARVGLALIENLSVAALNARPLNSVVRRLPISLPWEYRMSKLKLRELIKSAPLVFSFVLLVVAIASFGGHGTYVEFDSPTVMYRNYSWWGLKSETFEVRWMRASGYDYEAWCRKAKDGSWYPYIIELDGPPSE